MPPQAARKASNTVSHEKYHKKSIPGALREQVYLKTCGKKFEHKCHIKWCQNKIDVWNFECGHNIPESLGGATVLDNLHAICSRCNKSMGNRYTIDQWTELSGNSHGCLCF